VIRERLNSNLLARVHWAQRVLELHGQLLGRARSAIDCWSVAARRLGVAKDIRVMIAKMAWEEVWRWGEQDAVKQEHKS
jgi:hypothetical protein